jgi:light-regulated signal transduction histidine kinase (bacteriophytochrome)
MVASYVQLLASRYQGKLDSDADEFINYAVDGANRMNALINDLLTYSRVSTHAKPMAHTSSEAALMLALSNLQLAIEDAGATITHDPLPEVMGDDVQLVQLFQNLIGNAIKFRRDDEPPRVHLSARSGKGEWIFSVSDNGIGFETQYLDRIFGMFQRLHDRADYPGTGMGLAICRRIVERHHGRIWAESEPGVGSTFHFALGAPGG